MTAVAPRSVVVGIGARPGVPAEEVLALVADSLRAAGVTRRALAALATVEARAAEPGIVAAAGRLAVPLVGHRADVLAGIEVPSPSEAVRAATGTASVAEAAALASAPGGRLLLAKRRSAPATGRPAATAAVARRAT